ncbi:MAG: ABC transporter ATP-binding protein/permease [Bacilli bacterium]|nr:ABC transporter ATP-binding protein/permease [Bacilli bacterium]
MIKIDKLNKYYNKGRKNQIHVINNTSILLPDKGLVALLGPSGCGKTTLLNAIGGLDKVNKGHIYINDKKITRRSVRAIDKIRNLNIGYIFQDYKLIDNMTVYDNVAISLKMIGIKDKKEIKKRVDYILERVGIYRYRHRPCSMLSGGERQRVGIARALVKNPDIILADEPTGNLDSKNTIEIMNIIKSISRDKLVILVTHEVDLAKFYATRIIELIDGKIVNDYNNKNNEDLDYRIDNKFYLKDFKYHNENKDNDINIDYYSDNKNKLNLIIIVKNGNLYIKNKDNEKIEVIDSSSNIELINDNYKKLDKSVYEKYSFDFDKIINKDIKLKYSSIFNIFTIFSNGFKKVFGYSFVKKLLLIGFFLSSLFVTYSVSNVLGILNIRDKDFVTTNKNYLVLDNVKIKVSDYLEYEKDNNIEYILPGNSMVSMKIESGIYYQTQYTDISISGSLASISMINNSDLIYGRMPRSNNEIVIDKMVYDKTQEIEMIGLYELEKMIDINVCLLDGVLEYKIVGIVNMESPSIYAYEGEFINIIDNSGMKEDNASIFDYSLYKDKLKIVKGSSPKNDYEVIVNNDLKDVFKLNKYIDEIKINGKKLKVVGYYTSEDDINSYFVSSNTKKYALIEKSKGIVVYTKNKDLVISDYKEKGINLKNGYETDKVKYINEQKDSMISSIIVALIMLIISLIEIILMNRSSFLSRIKEVGIYRAIGVKKSDIYKMFTSESFAISTLASLPGVLFMSYCLYVLSDINYISQNYVMNIYVVIFCLVIMYVFNIVVGLIPVFNTMRKTPAQILSRHDLD